MKALMSAGVIAASWIQVAAQGTFQSLDFESATVPTDGSPLFVNSVLPGWQVRSYDERIYTMLYNAYNSRGPNLSLLGPDAPSGRIEGNYTALLMGVSIKQIGDVPSSAQSLLFKTSATAGDFVVSLGGIGVPVVPLQVTPDYVVYGGDISSFAGQTTVLAFSAHYLYLDSITFSPQPIPEPTCLGLLGSAAALAALRRSRERLRVFASGS